jgi:hypothetical protein
MIIKIDLEKFLDTATVDEYIKTEQPGTSLVWLKSFWAKYLVDENGQPVADADKVIGNLTLKQFRMLRTEGEIRDIAIPLPSQDS